MRTKATIVCDSEGRLRDFADALPEIVWIASATGRVEYVNRRWTEMTGLRALDVNDSWRDCLHPDDRARWSDAWRHSVAARLAHEHEVRMRRADGSWRWHLLRACPVRDNDLVVTHWCGTATDIDDHRRLAEALRESESRRRADDQIAEQRRQITHLGRVVLLGELSGAIAHELNQPLTAILANARAAQRSLRSAPPNVSDLCEILDDIASSGRRAGAVVNRIRGLLRRSVAESQFLSINEIVVEVLELAHSDFLQRGIRVTSELERGLPPIHGDRVQLQQVMLNLILNACDAMAEVTAGDRALTITTLAEERAIHLTVSDCGTGIADGARETIFKPFVTTKRNGLGLGLAICRSILEAHRGRLWAINNQDRGATFHLRIPTAAPVEGPREDRRGERRTFESGLPAMARAFSSSLDRDAP